MGLGFATVGSYFYGRRRAWEEAYEIVKDSHSAATECQERAEKIVSEFYFLKAYLLCPECERKNNEKAK